MKTATGIAIGMSVGLIAAASYAGTCGSSKSACGSEASSAQGQMINASFQAKGNIVETAVGAGSFKTLVAAVKAAGLADVLSGKGPFTVFAPTDEAFAKLPKGTVETLLKPENKEVLKSILLFHVVEGEVPAGKVVKMESATTLNGQRASIKVKGGEVMLDEAKVVKTDIACTNGVIHVIDSVIMPETRDILTVASEAGSFNTLAAAINAAGLTEVLQGDGPFTVFAPTDTAFAKLRPGTVESLLKPENREKLRSILLAHVVPGRVFADQAWKMDSAKTAGGATISLRAAAGTIIVDNAAVTIPDIEARNGVIHVIDTVIVPE